MIFGTDGIRAPFGQFPLNEETVRKLSDVLAVWAPKNALIVLGSDSRASCGELKRWLLSGLDGARVLDLGLVPTPVAAYETQARGAALGVMLTASHNPPEDNGLKFFDGQGLKILYDQARQWSDQVSTRETVASGRGPEPEPAFADNYRQMILTHFSPEDFRGLRLGFDLANGAGAKLVKKLAAELELDAHFVGDVPNGTNINQGVGALYPETIARLIKDRGLDIGFALDGDGDRLQAAAPAPVHGDVVLYALFRLMRAEGLKLDSVAGTILCGLGLEERLRQEGCALVRTPVGDQNVLAEMIARDLPLGGEPSGHLIQADLFPAGDGFLAALRLARGLRDNPSLLRDAEAAVPRYPVFEQSYRVKSKPPLEEVAAVTRAAEALRAKMGEIGRLILRYSGTEPKIRVFVEAPDLDPLSTEIAGLENAIDEALA